MKKLYIPSLIILFCLVFLPITGQKPFNKGVNLTGWFDAGNARSIPFNKYSKEDFVNIKSLGCDVIRLPMRLHVMTNGAPDYIVDPVFFMYLDQAIDWAEELQINLILDNHTIEDAKSKSVETPLLKIWPQIAERYKDRSDYIYYEILNEPNTLTRNDWAAIQVKVVNAIRAVDTKHTIVVTGADWGGIYGLTMLPKLQDTNLIYSFHFYDPMLFTHQGASWTSPSMVDLGNVPFPYDETRMPACPESLKGTWVESSLTSNYKNDGTAAKLKTELDKAKAYATSKGVQVYCGELGVYKAKSNNEDRVNWYREVTGYLDELDIPWTMWDYQGGFGLFKSGSSEMFEYDINVPLAEAIGFTPPPFKEYELIPDSVGFNIYTDHTAPGILQGGAPGTGTADLFNPNAKKDLYCIYLTGLSQYTNLDFRFKYNKDLSQLVDQNYVLTFWFKALAPGASIVLRFLDTKTDDPEDHPWRMDYTINTSKIPFDGEWHLAQIPLSSFIDIGSWDNAWFNSTNSFDWAAVERFQIVAEHMALTGKEFWFDNIRISEPGTVDVPPIPVIESGVKAYPVPACDLLNFELKGSENGPVLLRIYDLTGRQLYSGEKYKNADAVCTFTWDLATSGGKKVMPGILLYSLTVEGKSYQGKVSVKY